MPLFWFTPVQLGGFGFSPPQISIFLAAVGISQAIWLLLIFPPLQHKFGTGGVLRGCCFCWPFLFALAPVCSELLRRDWTVAFWILAPISQIAGSGVSMAFSKLSPTDELRKTLLI